MQSSFSGNKLKLLRGVGLEGTRRDCTYNVRARARSFKTQLSKQTQRVSWNAKQASNRSARQARLVCSAARPDEEGEAAAEQRTFDGPVYKALYLDKLPEAGLETVQLIKVRFALKYNGSFGEGLRLVGGHELLGNWSLAESVSLKWSPGDIWRSDVIDMPVDGIFVYKYVVCKDGNPNRPMAWQSGNNQVLILTAEDAPMIEVFDNWKGDPANAYTAKLDGSCQEQAEKRLQRRVKEADSKLRAAQEQVTDLSEQLKRSRFESMALREEARLGAAARLALKNQIAAERRRGDDLEAQVNEMKQLRDGSSASDDEGKGREGLDVRSVVGDVMQKLDSKTHPRDNRNGVAPPGRRA